MYSKSEKIREIIHVVTLIDAIYDVVDQQILSFTFQKILIFLFVNKRYC